MTTDSNPPYDESGLGSIIWAYEPPPPESDLVGGIMERIGNPPGAMGGLERPRRSLAPRPERRCQLELVVQQKQGQL